MKLVNKEIGDSPFIFLTAFKNIFAYTRKPIVALLMIVFFATGLLCFVIEECVVCEFIEKDSGKLITYITIMVSGLIYFAWGMLPVIFKKVRPLYFNDIDNYKDCSLGLVFVGMMGFFFLCGGIGFLYVIYDAVQLGVYDQL